MANTIHFWDSAEDFDFKIPIAEGFNAEVLVFGPHHCEICVPQDWALFGYVLEGAGNIGSGQKSFSLSLGCYFTFNEGLLKLSTIRGWAVLQKGHKALPMVAGPIEKRGRLRYIDGCSDTLLIPPTVVGEPCLNHLHIPKGTSQTAHTHPSLRCGIIAKGKGICRTPKMTKELSPGTAFYIPKNTVHSFFTDEHNLDVIAFHPDSDFGPADHNHPMINKTIIDTATATSRLS